MPYKKPPNTDEWLMLLIVAAIAGVVDLLKVVARGDALSPRDVLVRHLARALLTSAGAAGVWSGLTEFRVMNPATSVAVACGVALIGVDVLETLLIAFLRKKTGGDDPPPPSAAPGGDSA